MQAHLISPIASSGSEVFKYTVFILNSSIVYVIGVYNTVIPEYNKKIKIQIHVIVADPLGQL